ncbi:hypothetical protein T492DRAFT_1113895 [Pavlovales sp. CCMP2436]|nr:hypothetical protein T492DRAFT_1113895 [Pavlovales sp. CCMP2436]
MRPPPPLRATFPPAPSSLPPSNVQGAVPASSTGDAQVGSSGAQNPARPKPLLRGATTIAMSEGEKTLVEVSTAAAIQMPTLPKLRPRLDGGEGGRRGPVVVAILAGRNDESLAERVAKSLVRSLGGARVLTAAQALADELQANKIKNTAQALADELQAGFFVLTTSPPPGLCACIGNGSDWARWQDPFRLINRIDPSGIH